MSANGPNWWVVDDFNGTHVEKVVVDGEVVCWDAICFVEGCAFIESGRPTRRDAEVFARAHAETHRRGEAA